MSTPAPYQGNEPYIFVSYPHKDSSIVMPIIQTLRDHGYRVWYDAQIELGRPWENSLASHIRHCAAFIAMLSPHYLDSANCCDELYFARECNKPSLLVYTSPTQMPDFLTMRYGRLQAIRLNDYPSTAVFCEALFAAPLLSPALSGEERNHFPEPPVPMKASPDEFAPVPCPAVSAQTRLEDGQHFVLRSADGQHRLVISQDITIIGRRTELQEYLTPQNISRQHACFRQANRQLYISNLSRNYTFLNGRPVEGSSTMLKAGDVITFNRAGGPALLVCIE